MEPFLEKMDELELALTDIDWRNLVIDDATFKDIETNLKEVTKMILDELDSDRNEALKNLAPLKDALGEEAYNELILKNEQYYDDLRVQIADGEKEILEIMNRARKDNRTLTEEEKKTILKIKEEMKTAGIKHLSETQTESKKILENLKKNAEKISADMATEIIGNAQRTKEETVKEAEEQYEKIETEAQRMLAVEAISKEEYEKIMDAARLAKEETIEDAETQYNEIEKIVKDKLGETARYIDFETGEIKSKWKVFTEDVKKDWSKRWGEILDKFGEWKKNMDESLDKFKTNFKKGWCTFWNSIGNFFIDIWNGIVGGMESAVNKVISGLNKLVESYNSVVEDIPLIGDKITIKSISKVSFGRVPRLNIPEFKLGGFPDLGQLFIAREAGAELVGSIGNRTAVANNEQIVEAVSRGVYEAMVAAMQMSGGREGSDKEIVFNFNGKKFAQLLLPELNDEALRLGYDPLLSFEGGM